MDIQALRKLRKTDFGKITGEFERIANPKADQPAKKSYADDRFWKLEQDKAGNASAVIRFLPRTEGDELPWVKVFSHGFQGPTGKWYIEDSLTTIGEEDPVSAYNKMLWNSGTEANKEVARKQKRKLNYIANILVVSDPKHPENEGKVFLFKFGKKIFDKIMDKARPTFEDEAPVNVFDLWEGADFKLRMRRVEGYPNYDQSVFAEQSAVMDGDEDQILEIVNQQHKLGEFVDPKRFKSYAELQARLDSVMGTASPAQKAPSVAADSFDDEEEFAPPVAKSAPAKSAPSKAPKAAAGDDDMLSYFQSIADED